MTLSPIQAKAKEDLESMKKQIEDTADTQINQRIDELFGPDLAEVSLPYFL